MKPRFIQLDVHSAQWRISMQSWRWRTPRWLPDLDDLVPPTLAMIGTIVLGVIALCALSATPFLGMLALYTTLISGVTAVTLFVLGVMPRYLHVRGPELVLTFGPGHIEVEPDWKYVPADRLTAVMAGLGWSEASGRRIPWTEITGARLDKKRRRLLIRLASREIVRLPVAGSMRWDRTLKRVAEQIEDQARRAERASVPRDLRALLERV